MNMSNKLRKFKNRLSSDVLVTNWSAGDQLAERFLHALLELKNAKKKYSASGQIKASNANLNAIASVRNKNNERTRV